MNISYSIQADIDIDKATRELYMLLAGGDFDEYDLNLACTIKQSDENKWSSSNHSKLYTSEMILDFRKREITNVFLKVENEYKSNGLGLRMFRRQVQKAMESKFEKILSWRYPLRHESQLQW